MRKDLNMRKGKMCAQSVHASRTIMLEMLTDKNKNNKDSIEKLLFDWKESRYTTICVGIDSEPELVEVYNKAKNSGLFCSLIKDAGLTEFNGVPTLTCCAIGPAVSEDIDKITGNLKLL